MGVKSKTKIKYFVVAFAALLLAIAMIVYPENAFEASVRGLNVWWNIVFPALLPFFIAAEVLTGLGVVHFVGVLLEPLMRPIFKVPGVGAFVVAVGLASGYPIGAMLTAQHRAQNDISKEEGERLMSFANTADPLFMSGAVAVGMLGWPQVGFTLVIAHYLSSISTGLLMRFHKPNARPSETPDSSKDFILIRAARALVRKRSSDRRALAKIMGEGILKSMNSLLVIGGFIICFSVAMEMLNASGIFSQMAALLRVPKETMMLLTHGVIEITIGCQQAAQSYLAMSGKIIAMSAIIAWSGLSVHGQVASFISNTDLSIKPFIVARVCHALLAATYTAVLFKLNWVPALPTMAIDYVNLSLGARYWFTTINLFKILAVLGGTGLVIAIMSLFRRMKVSTFKVNQPRS